MKKPRKQEIFHQKLPRTNNRPLNGIVLSVRQNVTLHLNLFITAEARNTKRIWMLYKEMV